ncbi:MAG: hypothetical protein WKF41_17450 [Gaiellaceae bacterium]
MRTPMRSVLEADAAAADAIRAAELAKKFAQQAKPPPPDPRTGPAFELLRRGEGSALARISPRRNRWPDLQRIDERVAEIDQRQARASAELQDTRERRQGADARYQLALADGLAAGQPGDRPVSEVGRLEERIAALEAEIAAHDLVRERVLEERVAFVVQSRKALVRDVEKELEERRSRCLELLDELEHARDDLIALAQTGAWARLYPSETLTAAPPFAGAIVGARLKVQERHLPGLKSQLPAASVYALLRADVDHCASAITVEQAAAAEGQTTSALTGREASWAGRAEDHARDRAEKAERIADYIKEWGVVPREY